MMKVTRQRVEEGEEIKITEMAMKEKAPSAAQEDLRQVQLRRRAASRLGKGTVNVAASVC